MDSNQRLDYLYKEYVRLNQQAEEYIKSAFEDFKLMGVIEPRSPPEARRRYHRLGKSQD